MGEGKSSEAMGASGDGDVAKEDAAVRRPGAECCANEGGASGGVWNEIPDEAADAPVACHDASGEATCCTCRHKDTERSDALQADITRRLNRAVGQLYGVRDMVVDNRYCGDVLTQLAAAESAVHRIAEIILQDHLETCVVEQVRAGNVEVVDEAMRLIKKFM